MDVGALRRAAETPVRMTAAEVGATADDLADAFAADPVFDWFTRPDARRPEARRTLFAMLLQGLALPAGAVMRPATGGAAAIWMPSEALSGGRRLVSELRTLPTLLRVTGLGRLGRMSSLRAAMDAAHPMERPHAYLWFLGVTPAAQGHGVGSRLLAAELARLDAAGRPAYLEASTERNVGLYARHGFEPMGEIRAAPDAPPLWPMWREPRG